MQYSQLYSQALAAFEKSSADFSEKALEIQILMERAFNLTRTRFWIEKQAPITDQKGLKTFSNYLKRLKRGEPLAYILKEKQFYDTLFHINRNTLIPRADTELLVEKALELKPRPVTILEIGSGCGNIAISIARQGAVRISATEKSPKALKVLRNNIARFKLEDRIEAIHTDMFPGHLGNFDLILSNPPYISEAEWTDLPRSVREYEPRMALVAGPRGIEFIEKIIAGTPKYLNPRGSLLLEIGYNQKEMVKDLLNSRGYSQIRFHKDINGIDRVVSAVL